MRNFYKIPTRFNFIGDRNLGSTMIGRGRKVLNNLVDQMNFQNLKTGQHVIHFGNGVIIRARVIFGVSNVDIFCPVSYGAQIEPRKECFCCCNFSVGTVLNFDDSNDENYYYYSVSACTKITGTPEYSIFENILGADLTKWEPGMRVAVLAYNSFLFDCERDNNDAKACIPISSELEHLSSEWRPTYRIIQLCGSSLLEYINV